MTPKLLKSFLKLAEMGNLSRSAAQLSLTQPALSRQMQLLETEVGARLFERNGRGVVLTEAGMVLRGRAERLLRDMEEIRRDLATSAREPEGQISIGLPTPLKYLLTVPLIDRLWTAAPKLRLRVFEGTPVQIRDLLNEQSLDLGVLSADEHGAGLLRVPLVNERLFIAGAPGCGFREDRPFDVDRLPEVGLAQASPQNGVTMILSRYFAKSRQSLDLRIEASSTHLMIGIVRLGHCYTVLPYSSLIEDIAAGNIVAAPLSRLDLHWALARRADRRVTVAMRAVLDELHALVEERVTSGVWKMARYRAGKADF